MGSARGSALWGSKVGRGRSLRGAAVAIVALALAPLASAGGRDLSGWGKDPSAGAVASHGVPAALLAEAQAKPNAKFDVVVDGAGAASTSDVVDGIQSALASGKGGSKLGIRRQYQVISGASAQLTGSQIVALAQNPKIGAITPDPKVFQMGSVPASALSNAQLWPQAAGILPLWSSPLAQPTIAIVDSGVDATRAADFGARVLAQQTFVSGSDGHANTGDGYGHGTFVAGLAAGEATGYAGAAPRAGIVSLDVLDNKGEGRVSDVVAAADWIYQNRDRYRIRVANFSLTGSVPASAATDPLDQAVERLWLAGIVVVTAAGNFNGTVGGVPYAPANDPWVITVGASDVNGTLDTRDDFAAPWSSRGYTPDGFLKPDLGAPGRMLNGPAPAGSAMLAAHPERQVAPGYMWMSGTSFAAPIVAGAAAALLALHPSWSPDDVKGALMVSAQPYAESAARTLGVGVLSASRASTVFSPPNPNAGLERHTGSSGNGGRRFDYDGWSRDARSNPGWNSPSWSSASWSSASWSSASWSSASWSSASWSSASWSSASWSSASWSSLTNALGALGSASWSSGTNAANATSSQGSTGSGSSGSSDDESGDDGGDAAQGAAAAAPSLTWVN